MLFATTFAQNYDDYDDTYGEEYYYQEYDEDDELGYYNYNDG